MFAKCQKDRHSGRDDGIQSHGCEAVVWLDPKSCGNVIGKLPSMALDTGILAGMTALTKISCIGLGTCMK